MLTALPVLASLLAPAYAAGIHQPIESRDGCDVCHTVGRARSGSVADRSTGCLTCHDGILAPSPFATWDTASLREHPFHVAYEGDDLREPALVLGAGLRLYQEDGGWWVECTSCHDAHENVRPAMLRSEGETCMVCHDM